MGLGPIALHRAWAKSYRPRVRVWFILAMWQAAGSYRGRRWGNHWCPFGTFRTRAEMREAIRRWWRPEYAAEGHYAVLVYRPGARSRIARRLS